MTRLLLPALLLCASSARADDWPRFRGPTGDGVAAGPEAPVEWGPGKNVRWRAELGGLGNSSPIVSAGRVFVTVSRDKGKGRQLHCFDRKSGSPLWTASLSYPQAAPTHAENPGCGSTPCADGERVVVWDASAGLHCYDFSGKELWSRDLGKVEHMWGTGSSPVIHGNLVYVNVGPGDRTSLVAVDKRTGAVAWKADEPGGKSKDWIGSWCSPRVVTIDGAEQLLVGWPNHVKAYDPATGGEIWRCEGLGKLVYADVAVSGGIGVATGEDEGGDSIGFRLGGRGDVTASARLWARPRAMEVGTGLIVDGRLWTVDNNGVLRCTAVADGKPELEARLPGGPAWSSIVSCAGRLYVTTRSGDTVVFAPDPKAFAPLAVNRMGEPTNATPAISDGEIFLRTSKALYCIGKP